MIKTVQSIDEMNDIQMMTRGWGDRTWWALRVFSFTRQIRGSGHV